jgi:DNA-binding beta-propeller fold protein YncE
MQRFCAFLIAVSALAQTAQQPARAVTDPGVITTRQAITPAGVPSVFRGKVFGVTFGESSADVWVLAGNDVYRMDWKANRVVDRVALGGTAAMQGIRYDAGRKRAIAPSAAQPSRRVRLLSVQGGTARTVVDDLGTQLAGALAISGDTAAVPLTNNNQLAIIDVESGAIKQKVKTGIAPFGAVLNKAATVAYVTNWGGRVPTPNDLTAPTGYAPDADRVVIDSRGIAATGTVSRVDLASGAVTHTIPVELHPTAIVWDEPRHRVYVANGNKDSVSVIDDRQNRVVHTIALQAFGSKAAGIAPTALAVSGDGTKLYVACGGLNAVAVVNTAGATIEGFIPTAWYPSALSLSPDGKYLAVAALLGVGSGWNEAPTKRYVHAYRGSISVIDLPDAAQLASYTTAVAENNRLSLAASKAVPSKTPVAIPARAGDPSLIEHVVYIIKENRTYDQLFGDMPKGNGDPSLVLFGEDVAPNHRRLADQFVLLDNFYATGGNSGDGHQWVTQANETAYCMWPGYLGRSYPFDGSDPIAYSNSGFIWDLALARGKTVRVYGEYAGRLPEPVKNRPIFFERWKRGEDFTKEWNITAPIAPLNKILARNFPSYTNSVPDVVRADIFLADLKRWQESGSMPNFVILQLPCDHTLGTTPGASTPRAMVADNDLALGRIVEGLSQSPFWKKMAILVVEDDAQNGVDHVDGHRTVALAVSPYTRRGHVDSTFYSNQSMLKTIELILGLPTLSLFDMIANDMRASFHNTPDFTPYSAVKPAQSLDEVNPPLRALRGEQRRAARDSARMRWETPDAAPTERLNRIVWHSIKGWNKPYPPVRQASFAPLSLDIDDEDREEGEEEDERPRTPARKATRAPGR